MAIHPEHELHTRRRGRNLGLGLALSAFTYGIGALIGAGVGI